MDFKTVTREYEGYLEDRKSRFLAIWFPSTGSARGLRNYARTTGKPTTS
ncbi:MAG: hypothetical protein AAFY24_02760 [Pseudomonadota bacterium]